MIQKICIQNDSSQMSLQLTKKYRKNMLMHMFDTMQALLLQKNNRIKNVFLFITTCAFGMDDNKI